MLCTLKHNIGKLIAAVVIAAAAVSCSLSDPFFSPAPPSGPEMSPIERVPNNDYRKVFIVYMMGFNNLTYYLKQDAEDLIYNRLMSNPRDALIIFSHRAEVRSGRPSYSEPVSPTLTRVSVSEDGRPVCDTLWVLPDTYKSSDANTLNEVLTFVKDRFEADSYGLLMSSHGTGWMPENYCNHPDRFDKSTSGVWRAMQQPGPTPKPYMESIDDTGDFPAVKSIGVQNIDSGTVEEMDITDIAKAIPMRLEFIIFDACFMGGVEVAYEFRNTCDKMVFSQTEILADGMDYTSMSEYIFDGTSSDLTGFCENYFQFYDKRSGTYQSATISLVDCTRLELLADACRTIFTARRDGIAAIEGNDNVQKYYRNEYKESHQWFFDLRDIAIECGASPEEIKDLDEALDSCILFKAATKIFISRPIHSHCGLSMYLPYRSRTYLNNFYKTLEWNKATGLVE